MVKLATTLESALRIAKSLEEIVKQNSINQDGVLEKILMKDPHNPAKKNKFSKPSPNSKKPGGSKEAKWCEKCRTKHFRQFIEDVICYRCGKIGHYSNQCTTDQRMCFKCGEPEDFRKYCMRKEEVTQTLQMTHRYVKEEEDVV